MIFKCEVSQLFSRLFNVHCGEKYIYFWQLITSLLFIIAFWFQLAYKTLPVEPLGIHK